MSRCRGCFHIPGSTCALPVAYPAFIDFFFLCYLLHRDLHSFPTRRSSDLCRPSRRWRTTSTATCARRSSASAGRCRRARSEEHTSELQSPYDLVCRLLLEKKHKSTCC